MQSYSRFFWTVLIAFTVVCVSAANCLRAQETSSGFERLLREQKLLNMSNAGPLSSQADALRRRETTARSTGLFAANEALLAQIKELQPVLLRQRIEFAILQRRMDLLNVPDGPTAEEQRSQLNSEIVQLQGTLTDENVAARIEEIRRKVLNERSEIAEQAAEAYLQMGNIPSADLQSDSLDTDLTLSEEQLSQLKNSAVTEYLELTQRLRQLESQRDNLENRIRNQQERAHNGQLSQTQRNQAERVRLELLEEYRTTETEITRTRVAIRRIVSTAD